MLRGRSNRSNTRRLDSLIELLTDLWCPKEGATSLGRLDLVVGVATLQSREGLPRTKNSEEYPCRVSVRFTKDFTGSEGMVAKE